MNLLKKLKLVTGIQKSDNTKNPAETYCEILKDDTNDVIFAKKLIQNNGNFFYCEKKYELIHTLQALTNNLNTQLIYCIEPILQELLAKSKIDYNKKEYQTCDTILSSCEYLIAHQGKIMLSSKQLGSNNIKNLPKKHIIVAYTSQIVKSLNEAMSGINMRYMDNLPSTITTIKSNPLNQAENIEGNIKNLSVLLIEDFQDSK